MKEHIRRQLADLHAARTGEQVCYISTPITSGRRGYELLDALGAANATEAEALAPGAWREEVITPNEQRATQWAATLTELGRYDVINPAETSNPGWTQNCYDDLWAAVIREYTPVIAPAPDWAYSRGARHEIQLALNMGLRFVDQHGNTIEPEAIMDEWRAADTTITERGWDAYGTALPQLIPPAHLRSEATA